MLNRRFCILYFGNIFILSANETIISTNFTNMYSQYTVTTLYPNLLYRPNYLGDLELEADLIHDYTAALQLDDPGWFSHSHIEDTDWQDQG